MKRIFIAINLPEEVKESLVSFQDQWPDLPANWTKKENLHITLQFLGNVSDKELEKVIEKLTSAGKNHASFEGTLRNIVYGPTKSRPSMVWAFAEKSSSLAALQKD
ncbi:MAG: RNA 2',3'-cyclic phosphodiesterase, partial [bacterium]|nr:RNA 2',3'-cyclic phosphodiesterase [bacterium]